MNAKLPLKKLFGSKTGITKVFLDNSLPLRKFLTRYLSSDIDIDDILQQTYVNAYSEEKSGKKIVQPKSFLFSVAKNIALNELNRKSRKITDSIEDCMPDGANITTQPSLETELEAHQALGAYCEAIALLPEKCRQVYLLRKVHGLSHNDIALRMNISPASVEKHLHRGMSKCRDYLAKRKQLDETPPTAKVLPLSGRGTHHG